MIYPTTSKVSENPANIFLLGWDILNGTYFVNQNTEHQCIMCSKIISSSTCCLHWAVVKLFNIVGLILLSLPTPLLSLFNIVCEIQRSMECVSPLNFRTQGSFIHINSRKIFERHLFHQIASQNLRHKNLGFSET